MATRGLRTFYVVWIGQLVSLTGTSLTSFGLAIFVFLESSARSIPTCKAAFSP